MRLLLAALALTLAGCPGCGDDSPTGPSLFIVTIDAHQDGPADGGFADVIVSVQPQFNKKCANDGAANKNECVYTIVVDRAAASTRTNTGHAKLTLPVDPNPYTFEARHVATASSSETKELTVR